MHGTGNMPYLYPTPDPEESAAGTPKGHSIGKLWLMTFWHITDPVMTPTPSHNPKVKT